MFPPLCFTHPNIWAKANRSSTIVPLVIITRKNGIFKVKFPSGERGERLPILHWALHVFIKSFNSSLGVLGWNPFVTSSSGFIKHQVTPWERERERGVPKRTTLSSALGSGYFGNSIFLKVYLLQTFENQEEGHYTFSLILIMEPLIGVRSSYS
jgi:hypothetical protein